METNRRWIDEYTMVPPTLLHLFAVSLRNTVDHHCLMFFFISQLVYFLWHIKNRIGYIQIGVPYLKLYAILYDLIFMHHSVSKVIVLCGLYHINYIFTMYKFKQTQL